MIHQLPAILILSHLLFSTTSLPSQESLVVRAARMVDVTRGEMVAPALVVISEGKIQRVGGSLPAGARIVDLGDLTLMPGLIDAHTHLTGDIEGDWILRSVRELPADAALRGARNAARTLLAGFTTVRDLGAAGFADVSLMKAIDAGFVIGPRMIPSAHAIGISGGHCDETGWAPGIRELGPEQGIGDGFDEVTKAVRYQIKHGARVIKVCATAGVLSSEATLGAQQLSDAELQAIVQEVARHGLKVAAHAHGVEGTKAAIRAGVASIEHGSVLDDEAVDLMKQRGTYLVPTTALRDITLPGLSPLMKAKRDQLVVVAKESLRRAIRAGVKIALGTDAGVLPHGRNAEEAVALVDRGMRPADVIRSATVSASDLLGLSDRGIIAPGKLADLIAVRGNPLVDVRTLQQVVWVMKGGDVVKAP